jgi:hypothetical protein
LAGVLDGRYAPAVLDSYHSERYAHVQAVIKQALQIGEIIQTRNPLKAFARDTFLRLGKLVPKLLSGIQFGQTWRLGDGLLADESAAGWQIPQPMIHHADGADRLDSFLPPGFCVLALNADECSDLQRVSDAHQALQCPIICLGDDLTAADMAIPSDIGGFLLRPDRQIFATLKNGEASMASQLEAHMQALSAALLADGHRAAAP